MMLCNKINDGSRDTDTMDHPSCELLHSTDTDTTITSTADTVGASDKGQPVNGCHDNDPLLKVSQGGDLHCDDPLQHAQGDLEVREGSKDTPTVVVEMTSAIASECIVGGAGGEKVDDDASKADGRTADDDDESRLLQDHGWAWMVCFGGFWSHVIIGGFERSDGVLFLEFKDKFQQSAQLTAWPGAIVSTIRLIMGPAATALSNRTSARTATMLGSFIFAFGLFISGFAPNLIFLFFSYGLIQGIGRGLIYAPGLVIVGMYFNKRRGLGVGLATAGVGVGTFIFPPLVEWLFENKGFQGAFLILAALALHTCISGALYRPLYVHRNIVLSDKKKKFKDEEQALCTTAENTELTDCAVQIGKSSTMDSKCGPEYFSDSQGTRSNAEERSRLWKCLKTAFFTCFPVEKQKKDAPKRKLIEWGLLKNPAFLFYCFSICLFTAAFKSAFTFLPALAESKGILKSDSAYLLSISGVLDTFGRIMAGLVLDIKCIRPLRPIAYNGVVFLITAISFAAPLCVNFVEFAVLFGLYGMLTGTYVSQKSVILVDMLGLEKLSSSFGLMIAFQGIGSFVGPPLSGLLRDVFGSYNEAFYLGGGSMAVAGLLMVLSNIFMILRKRSAVAKSLKTDAQPS